MVLFLLGQLNDTSVCLVGFIIFGVKNKKLPVPYLEAYDQAVLKLYTVKSIASVCKN